MSSYKLYPAISYTPARTIEEITRYYFYLLNAEKKIADAVSCAIVGRTTKFKNQLDRFVDIIYYNEVLTIVDKSLAFERHFKIPLEISKLGASPTMLDYLGLPKDTYEEEPYLKEKTVYKEMYELDQIVKELRKDFNLSISGSLFSLKQLTRENNLIFDNNLIKVDNTITPAVVVLRDNYKKYKRVRYSLTKDLIKEINYL